MAIEVTKTTYETGPDKELIVVDVYGESDTTKPTNNEPSAIAALDQMKIEDIIPKSAGELFTGMGKLPNLDVTDAIKMLTDVVGDPKAFGKAVGNNLMNDVLKGFGFTGTVDDVIKSFKEPINFRTIIDAAGEQNETLKMMIGEVEAIIDKGDLRSAQGISQVINQLTGNDNLTKILNMDPKISVVKGMVDEAMRLGLPEAVDALIESFDDDDSKRKIRLFSTVNAATNTDLDFIEKQIDSPDIGSGAIVSLTPDITSSILENYKLKGDSPEVEDVQKLMRVLNKLDEGWMSYNRGGDHIDNLLSLTGASNDALRVLLKDPATYVAALISGDIDITDMVDYTLSMREYTPSSVLKV